MRTPMKFLSLTCVLLGTLFPFSAAMADALNADQKAEVNTLIKTYVQEHPQDIVESIVKHRQDAQDSEAKKLINAHKDAIFEDARDPFLGTVDAPIEIVEFMDYQCGHCKETAPELEAFVAGRNDVKLTIKMLPIFGGASAKAAKASLAAFAQGQDKFRQVHKALLAHKGALKDEDIAKASKDSGVDADKGKAVADADSTQKHIDENFDLAQSVNIVATPTFAVINKKSGGVAFIQGLPAHGADKVLNKAIEKAKKG